MVEGKTVTCLKMLIIFLSVVSRFQAHPSQFVNIDSLILRSNDPTLKPYAFSYDGILRAVVIKNDYVSFGIQQVVYALAAILHYNIRPSVVPAPLAAPKFMQLIKKFFPQLKRKIKIRDESEFKLIKDQIDEMFAADNGTTDEKHEGDLTQLYVNREHLKAMFLEEIEDLVGRTKLRKKRQKKAA